MKKSSELAISAAIILAVAIPMAQLYESMAAKSGCESEGLYHCMQGLQAYARVHGGQIPRQKTAVSWASHQQASWRYLPQKCNKGPFVWSDNSANQTSVPTRPIVWDAKPHGLIYRWRNVIFDDLKLRAVPERDFVRFFTPSTPPDASRYTIIHPNG